MPTTKPRIQVTLTQATYDALSALAKQQSRSRGSIAAEMLNELLPQVGAAYALVQDLTKKSPTELAALRKLADNLDQHNRRMLEAEVHKLPGPHQVDIAEAIASAVRRGPTRTLKHK